VETAKLLNIPQGTAATRQRRALSLLKLALEEE
jgi:DNA-directed RNA polymerase specialized sigma24 family protein